MIFPLQTPSKARLYFCMRRTSVVPTGLSLDIEASLFSKYSSVVFPLILKILVSRE